MVGMNLTDQHNEAKTSILRKAEMLFMRLGLKSISMDDVARELGISKKTLYQFFQSKEDLVLQTIQRHQCTEAEDIKRICEASTDALKEMLDIARHVLVQFQQMSPSTVFDLKKYYPEAWRIVEQVQREHVYGILKANMERGIREGLYRNDFDTNIMARLYVGSVRWLLDEELFPHAQFHWAQLYREFIHYHLRGIVSQEGLKKLKTYIQDL